MAPVTLTTKGFFLADYQVSIAPLVWTLSPEASAGAVARRTFQVTEFLKKLPSDGESTIVRSESPEASIEGVGAWRDQGWRPGGYARETEITVSVRIPAEEATDRKILLKFERLLGPAGREATTQASATVTILLRVL